MNPRYEITQTELAYNVSKYLRENTGGKYHICLHMVYFPDLPDTQISALSGYSVSYVQEVGVYLKTSVWDRRRDDNDFLAEIRAEFFLDTEILKKKYPQCFAALGYRFVVHKGKTKSPGERINRRGLDILKRVYPKMLTKYGHIKQPLLGCICNMHAKELDYWLTYLEKEDAVVYPIEFHNSRKPFNPRMICPNIDPVIAEHLITQQKFNRNFLFFEMLNGLSVNEQYRKVFPPKLIGPYAVYQKPANQYELAGFKPHQMADRSYLISKTSPSVVDRRTKLLNCLNIIRRNFPEGEGGAQDLRRLLGNLFEIIDRGDEKEIKIWKDAFLMAPETQWLDIHEIDFQSYKRKGL